MKTRTRKGTPALIFPRLVFARDARIGKRRTRVKVFRLDWTEVDEARMFPKLVRRMRRKIKARLHPLSAPLKSRMNILFFAIPRNYLKEIGHYGKMAVEEWGRRRGFDTSVNDECLTVAKECVGNFFYLLSDCLFEPGWEDGKPMTDHAITRTWADYGIEASWKCAMLFRFWLDQTGGGWVSRNAKVDELEDLKCRISKKPQRRMTLGGSPLLWSEDEKKTIQFVLRELGKHPCSKPPLRIRIRK